MSDPASPASPAPAPPAASQSAGLPPTDSDPPPPAVEAEPILEHDHGRRLELAVPAGGRWIFAAAFGLLGLANFFFLPRFGISAALFLGVALWSAATAVWRERLSIDLDARTWHHGRGPRTGWTKLVGRWRSGSLDDDLRTVVIAPARSLPGLVASTLRSRRLWLEMGASRLDDDTVVPGRPDDGSGEARIRFALSYPMGPRVAVDQAAELAERLGVAVDDRSFQADRPSTTDTPTDDPTPGEPA